MTSSTQDENLKAFDRLMKRREFEQKQREGSTRYYEDLYGNRYGWYVARQSDGKFHAFITRKRASTKHRAFRTKKKAISWAYQNFQKHNDRQVSNRKKRREIAESKKPKLTEPELREKKYRDIVSHNEKLLKKNQSKIKSLETRSKTYKKRIKYATQRLMVLTQPQL